MSTPLTKRRKLNNTSALLKPFKSPLRLTPSSNSKPKPKLGNPLASQELHASNKPTATSLPVPVSSTTPPLSPAKKASTSPPKLDPSLTLDIPLLQRQHTSLLNRLSSLRTEKDKLDQALKIESSSRDEELETLIKQWRTASQEAAEEVYADVRDRVNGMGGLQAWRERERGRVENGWGWGEDEKGRGKGEEEGNEEGDGDRDDGEEAEGREGGGEGEGRKGAMKGSMLDAENESEGFTMDMMLRTLNVELEAIGYDKENQRWVT